MQAKQRLTFPVLCVTVGLLLLGVAGCGDADDDGGDSGSATVTETTETTETESESGEGTAGGGNAPAPSGDAVRSAKVEIVEFTYEPDPVTIEEGGKVTWINRDSAPHTATAEDDSFDTGTLAEGKLKSESFKDPGTFAYICSIHPEMQGTVEVVGS
jgi:plastocyanin